MFETLESIFMTEESDLKNLNFLGLTSCPMRQLFRENVENTLQKYKEEKNLTLKCYIPSGCHGNEDVEQLLNNANIDEFPDVFSALGFNDMFNANFVKNLVNKGFFKSTQDKNIHKEFLDAGCLDPEEVYSMYSVSPVLMLVDNKKLGDLPLPKTWADLLNPIYKNNIIISGSEEEIHGDQILYFYKEFGDEGLKTLAKNIKNAWHPVEMSRTAGTSNLEGAAIYILPLFFAKSCPKQENISIIWPEDGALVCPVCIVAKESKLKETDVFTKFLTGVKFGTKCANNYFPALNANVNNNLPPNSKFKWLGWDYIRANNLEELKLKTNEIFIKAWKEHSK